MNLLNINYANATLTQTALTDSAAAPTLDNAVISRDSDTQVTFSGTLNGQTVWHQMYIVKFPCLVCFDANALNFSLVYDITQLDPSLYIVDIYYE